MENIKKNASSFWEKFSLRKDLSSNSLMNLETDSNLSLEKFNLEKKFLLEKINLNPLWNVVDLGGGIGNWSKYFSRYVKQVYLVEKQKNFLDIALKKNYSENINYINMSADNFTLEKESIDLVFCSGLSIYLDDFSFNNLLINSKKYLKKNGLFVHRDAYGVEGKFLVNNYSKKLNSKYSAIYRSREQYKSFFELKNNFKLISDEDMYPKNSKFNKWNETRLRLAIYKKK